MKRNEFCAVLRYFFAQFAQNQNYFLRKLRLTQNFSFVHFFLRNLRKTESFTKKINFLGKLSEIDIL